MRHDMLDQLQGMVHQESGERDGPPAIFLPGVHGDWTLLKRARPILADKLRLIEITYPRAGSWNLGEFSRALEDLMDVLELDSAHLIAESFGSLIGWQFGLECPSRVRSMVLVGGFCQPPGPQRIGLAKTALSLLPSFILEKGIDLYTSRRAFYLDFAYSDLGGMPIPYFATRSARGRRATVNRLSIIERADFRPHLNRIRFPIRYVGGANDQVVPVRREVETLKRRLPAECGFQSHVIPGGRHAILASHPEPSARRIVDWVVQSDSQFQRPEREQEFGAPPIHA